jgi:hypothetical protein
MRLKFIVTLSALLLLFGCSQIKDPKNSTDVVSKTQQSIQLQKIEDLENILETEFCNHDPCDILVIFDFNYTLLYPTELALQKRNINKYKKAFVTLLKSIPKEKCDQMMSNVVKTTDQKPVSSKTPFIIRKFRERGVNFIVCTGSLTQTNGKSSAEIIRKLLRTENITMGLYNFPFDHLNFNEFNKYLGVRPAYDKGIITANRSDKGSVLTAFFKKLTKMPKVVIFIDNNPQKVDDVLKIANIFSKTKFIVCEYKEYENLPASEISEKEFLDFWKTKIAGINAK